MKTHGACFGVLVLGLLAIGCSEDGSDPSLGTGSSGGNPLVIGFDTDLSSKPQVNNELPDQFDPLHWLQQPLVVHVGHMSIARPDPVTGVCPDVNGSQAVQIDFLSEREGVLTIEAPAPCAILLKPKVGEPLFSFQIWRVIELSFEQGIIIDIDDSAGLEASLARMAPAEGEMAAVQDFQNIFIIFDMTSFIANFGLGLLQPDGPLRDEELDLESRLHLWGAMLESTFVYLDPTPGDSVLAQDERNSENRIATIRSND